MKQGLTAEVVCVPDPATWERKEEPAQTWHCCGMLVDGSPSPMLITGCNIFWCPKSPELPGIQCDKL